MIKKFVIVLFAACLLAIGCSNSQEHTEVLSETNKLLFSPLVTDGTSVWTIVDTSNDFDEPSKLIKIDAATSQVKWIEEYGIGGTSDLVPDGNVFWTEASKPLTPTTPTEDQIFLRIDAETGDIVKQQNAPDSRDGPIRVGDTMWVLGSFPDDIYIYDIDTMELNETIDFSSMVTPDDGRNINPATDFALLDNTMWILNGAVLVGLDTTSYEIIDFIDPDDGGLDLIEVHDGLLWVAERDKPEEGTFSYNPQTKETTPSTLFESPIGNKYHNGYTYDMVDTNTIAQINTETGEEVATFTDLDPFSIAVTDGYLWAHDGTRILRYETKP